MQQFEFWVLYMCNNCDVCKFALPSHFVYDNFNLRYRILSFLNCQSKNCVISLYCKKCGPISIRFCSSNAQEYITCILKIIHTKFHDPLFLHFNSSSHDINDFGFQVIQSISFRFPYNILLKWILRLKTFSDQGIDFYLFYPQRFWFTVPFVNNNCKYIISNLCKRFNPPVDKSFSS